MVSIDRAYGPWDARVQRYWRFVTTPNELRNALRDLTILTGTGSRLAPGGRIVFAAPMKLKSPIIVNAPGLVFSASAYLPIRANGVISTMFDIRAEFVRIEDLYVPATPGNGFTTFVTMSGSALAGRNSDGVVVRGNKVDCDRLLVDASAGGSDDGQLLDNVQVDELNGAHAASVYIASPRWLVRGNTIKDGGGDSITVDAGSGECRLLGNDLGFGDITTTLSSGGGIIDGNSRKGVITAPGDTVGDNS